MEDALDFFNGGQTGRLFRLAAIEKVTTGLTTVEEVKRVLHRNALPRRVQKAAPSPPIPLSR